MITRRLFNLATLGTAVTARSAFSQAPTWSHFKPHPGSIKERIHTGKPPVRMASAPVDSTRSQLEAIIRKQGQVDLFSLDSQHRPMPREDDLVKFCKLAEQLGAGVQLRIPHPRMAYLTGRFADLGVLSIMVPLVASGVTNVLRLLGGA